MRELESNKNLETSEGMQRVIKAGYDLLASFGYSGNEIGKAWGFFRDFHRF